VFAPVFPLLREVRPGADSVLFPQKIVFAGKVASATTYHLGGCVFFLGALRFSYDNTATKTA
jgi:hypothetical protein